MELALVVITGLSLLIAAGGWFYTIKKAIRAGGFEAGKVNGKFELIYQQLSALPCKQDINYDKDRGMLLERLNNIEERLIRIEDKVNGKG